MLVLQNVQRKGIKTFVKRLIFCFLFNNMKSLYLTSLVIYSLNKSFLILRLAYISDVFSYDQVNYLVWPQVVSL